MSVEQVALPWRVIVTWRETDPVHQTTGDYVRIRDFATLEEAQKRYEAVQALIDAGTWRPTLAAFDIQADPPVSRERLDTAAGRPPARPTARERWQARTELGRIRNSTKEPQ